MSAASGQALSGAAQGAAYGTMIAVSYTHLRAHET